MEKSEKTIRHQMKEMLKREFRVVKNGLDPDEVMAYLETIMGSSEAALKRLEHFSSLQKLSMSMEAVIAETNQAAEHIKAQARQEAEAEKNKIVEEANQAAEHIKAQARLKAEAEKNQVVEETKRQAEEKLEQASKKCIASIEGTNSLLIEVITKAREMVEAAFRKAEEMAAINTEAIQQGLHNIVEATSRDLDSEEMAAINAGAMQQDIHNIVEAGCRRLNSVLEESANETPTSPQIQAVDTSSDGRVPETVAPKEQLLDLAKLLESEAAPDVILMAQPTGSEFEEEKQPINVEAYASALEEDNFCLYSGEVTLVIPQGTGQSWMRQLRQQLISIPGVHIQLESGTNVGGNMVTLLLDEPVALPSVLLEMPNVKKVIKSQNDEEPSEGSAYRQGHSIPGDQQQTTLTIELNEDAIE